MRISEQLNYELTIKNDSREVKDLALGLEKSKEDGVDIYRCGIDMHSMSFIPTEIISQDYGSLSFKVADGHIITFRIIDAKLFKELRGKLFTSNAPEIKDDDEVQEYINSERYSGYY